ncbi:hypothetical protein FEM48_Zijuj11G0013500 [Ziziphus jujuba var. spinosa]|uniref:DUF7890 domain-containing protein n=1 Tax=Ziziphus jujuba var. spinosa TaxID=714518 RepID=A0A978UG10_ZIZJJ|nr:hypothetical protein FEM48_Zijuj11G0013500 [Ziziphus jujuba var. spinosa]
MFKVKNCLPSTCFADFAKEEELKVCHRGVISCGGSGEEKGARIRIKVKMTKEEAARVLSKCKNGGVLEFKDFAAELVQIPSNRVSVLPPPSGDSGVVLKTVPEEV